MPEPIVCVTGIYKFRNFFLAINFKTNYLSRDFPPMEQLLKNIIRTSLLLFVVGFLSCQDKKTRKVLTSSETTLDIQFNHINEPLPELKFSSTTTGNDEFQTFLNQFDYLPPEASEVARSVYSCGGIVNEFEYESASTISILADRELVLQHTKAFLEKYKWTDEFKEESVVNSIDYAAGEYLECKKTCWESLANLAVSNENDKYELKFVSYLVLVNHLSKKGSVEDKKFALELSQVMYSTDIFRANAAKNTKSSIVYKSIDDIYLPLMDDNRNLVTDQMIRHIYSVYKSSGDLVKYANFLKWVMRNDFSFFKEPSNYSLKDTFLLELNNVFLDAGLDKYAIYVIHCVKGKKLHPPFDDMAKKTFFSK